MKKLIFILSVLALTVCLVGCEIDTPWHLQREPDNGFSVWTDEETGVQYIIYQYRNSSGGLGGITPRLNPDGTLYGCEEDGAE